MRFLIKLLNPINSDVINESRSYFGFLLPGEMTERRRISKLVKTRNATVCRTLQNNPNVDSRLRPGPEHTSYSRRQCLAKTRCQSLSVSQNWKLTLAHSALHCALQTTTEPRTQVQHPARLWSSVLASVDVAQCLSHASLKPGGGFPKKLTILPNRI